jgi:hypothetical protein
VISITSQSCLRRPSVPHRTFLSHSSDPVIHRMLSARSWTGSGPGTSSDTLGHCSCCLGCPRGQGGAASSRAARSVHGVRRCLPVPTWRRMYQRRPSRPESGYPVHGLVRVGPSGGRSSPAAVLQRAGPHVFRPTNGALTSRAQNGEAYFTQRMWRRRMWRVSGGGCGGGGCGSGG